MKRTLSILFFVLFGFAGIAVADTHLWITTEGAGIEYSTDGIVPGPPPHHHHHNCHLDKKYRKMKKKNKKKMKKICKSHDKVMNKVHKHH